LRWMVPLLLTSCSRARRSAAGSGGGASNDGAAGEPAGAGAVAGAAASLGAPSAARVAVRAQADASRRVAVAGRLRAVVVLDMGPFAMGGYRTGARRTGPLRRVRRLPARGVLDRHIVGAFLLAEVADPVRPGAGTHDPEQVEEPAGVGPDGNAAVVTPDVDQEVAVGPAQVDPGEVVPLLGDLR